jgi:hypothetical protein
MVFRNATTGTIVFLLLVIIFAFTTITYNRFGVVVIALAVGALVAILRIRERDADEKTEDASRCRECGMLPPEHKSWCVATRTKT